MVSKPIQVQVEAEERLRSLIKVAKPKRKEPSFTELVHTACDIIEDNPLKPLQNAMKDLKVWYMGVFGSKGLERLEEFLILFHKHEFNYTGRRKKFETLIDLLVQKYKDQINTFERETVIDLDSKDKPVCSVCQKAAIKVRCSECGDFFCVKCNEEHYQKIPSSKRPAHKTILVEV